MSDKKIPSQTIEFPLSCFLGRFAQLRMWYLKGKLVCSLVWIAIWDEPLYWVKEI